MGLQGVIFDLDGVITDTAEFHYQAWQKLADEEGLRFSREINEQLRGVSRRDSLQIILDGKSVSEDALQEMMARKNGYYQELLTQISMKDLLPGVSNLLDTLDQANIPFGLASASKNAPTVLNALGISDRFKVIADGNSVKRPKPAPDLFRYAAGMMNVSPANCVVVEDALAGVSAALSAGMGAVAVGPESRFEPILGYQHPVQRVEQMADVSMCVLQTAVSENIHWHVCESEFVASEQPHKETIFTIGNGYFASRGSLEEGHAGESALTFAHGIYDDMPVSFTELANLPNWLDFEIQIDQDTFKMSDGVVHHFKRALNLAQGVLRRDLRWESPAGTIVDLSFERFISYTHEHVGAIRLLATAVNQACTITVHAGINGHVANGDLLHWHLLEQGVQDDTVWLKSETRHTHIQLGAAAKVTSSGETAVACQECPGHPRLTVSQHLEKGQSIEVDKLASYTASRDLVDNADDVNGRALQALQNLTFDQLKQEQLNAWAALWQDCDVIIEGDDEAQLAIRFNLFQILVAASQNDDRVSIGAKTLSGLGYRGHVFWDTEIFILPFFTFTKPELARQMLMYRYHTLAGAREKAQGNGFLGAQYAWESAATGEEVTPTWVPHFSDRTKLVRIWTGDIQIHISADVVYAIMQYWQTTGDDDFIKAIGAEIILDTARFWGSRAEYEAKPDGSYQYAIRDVIGPDEYHDHVDNNSFTNYICRWHLQTAQTVLNWLEANAPEQASSLKTQLQIDEELRTHWHDVIENIVFLYDEESGLIDQFEGFFDRIFVPEEVFKNATQSLQVEFGIEGANDRQVLKQADVIMLLCLFRNQFSQKVWQKNWDVYMPKTDHRFGSSLGPSFHAWAACEMNRPDEAYEHFMLAARADLRNPRGNAGDGIHAASTGGVWQAVAFGFAGLQLTHDGYTLDPKLPSHWTRVSFKFKQHGQQHTVDIRK